MMKFTSIGKSFFLAVSALLICFSSQASLANVKIGVVDMQRAIQSVNQGKKAKANLEKEFNKKKVELEAEEKSIVSLRDEYQKKSLVMNEQTRSKKQAELQQKFMAYQQKVMESQKMIQEREAQLTQPIIEKMKGVIDAKAKEKGYTTVLEKSSNIVLYSQAGDDLTDEVIADFNKANK